MSDGTPENGRRSAAGVPAPEISLIVPVYNEEGNIAPLAEEIRTAMSRCGQDWELCFVDDGSTDGSLDAIKAETAADPRMRYIVFAENCGQSAALCAGFEEAAGEILVTLDSDLQNDPADVPVLLNLFGKNNDMVIGARLRRRDSTLKKASSRIANAVRNLLTRENIRDTGCSLKVLRASMARRLPMFRGMHRFLPTLMKMQGASVLEVPVSHRPRRSGRSKYGIWDRALSGLYDLLAVRWMQKRKLRFRIRERG
ncbi:MAG: glycosyltransferase family 2 protein [Desulfovibrio sp.]|jgi:glycosyltransferase involved in cell wall biosynthesis|nr:glycosyltransferase family 2 protein [Desulfovibrio sp.]